MLKSVPIGIRIFAQIINSQTKKIISLQSERDELRRQVEALKAELKAKR